MKYEIKSSITPYIPCHSGEAINKCFYFQECFLGNSYYVKAAPENTKHISFKLNLAAEETTSEDEILMDLFLHVSIFLIREEDKFSCQFILEGDLDWLGEAVTTKLDPWAVLKLIDCPYWSKKVITQEITDITDLESFFKSINDSFGFKPDLLADLAKHGFNFSFVRSCEEERRKEIADKINVKPDLNIQPHKQEKDAKNASITSNFF